MGFLDGNRERTAGDRLVGDDGLGGRLMGWMVLEESTRTIESPRLGTPNRVGLAVCRARDLCHFRCATIGRLFLGKIVNHALNYLFNVLRGWAS